MKSSVYLEAEINLLLQIAVLQVAIGTIADGLAKLGPLIFTIFQNSLPPIIQLLYM